MTWPTITFIRRARSWLRSPNVAASVSFNGIGIHWPDLLVNRSALVDVPVIINHMNSSRFRHVSNKSEGFAGLVCLQYMAVKHVIYVCKWRCPPYRYLIGIVLKTRIPHIASNASHMMAIHKVPDMDPLVRAHVYGLTQTPANAEASPVRVARDEYKTTSKHVNAGLRAASFAILLRDVTFGEKVRSGRV